MIARDQPDLKINGTFFSLMVIVLVNLLVISALLILASPQLSLRGILPPVARRRMEFACTRPLDVSGGPSGARWNNQTSPAGFGGWRPA